jgi:hypothetical protein
VDGASSVHQDLVPKTICVTEISMTDFNYNGNVRFTNQHREDDHTLLQDMKKEYLRINSYGKLASHLKPGIVFTLAKAGFYCDLNTKEAICAWCGLHKSVYDLNNQNHNDVFRIHKIERPECDFITGECKDNEAAHTRKQKSFGLSYIPQHASFPMKESYLVKENIMDTWEDIVSYNNDSKKTIRDYNPVIHAQDMVTPTPPIHKRQNILLPIKPERQDQLDNISKMDLNSVAMEVCMHPEYSRQEVRLNTFYNWASPQSIKNLCDAGFYYSGVKDNVQCFCCSGSLQSWDGKDNPCLEHAIWFPSCIFIQKKMGLEYMNAAEWRFPRTTRINPAYCGINIQNNRKRLQSSSNKSTSKIDEHRIINEMDKPSVQAVLDMGFPKDTVKNIIKQQLIKTGDTFASIHSLVDTLVSYPEQSNVHETQTETTIDVPQFTHILDDEPKALMEEETRSIKYNRSENQEKYLNSNNSVSKNPDVLVTNAGFNAPLEQQNISYEKKILLEENKALKEGKLCKICLTEEYCILFLPCRHIVCCATCAPRLTDCAVCRQQIIMTQRTYLT